jgi:anaerobic magnesium-protoporphyrin IX monomethyl ester cyclase
MKLTFIFLDFNPWKQKNFHFGIGALSASLKQAGHQVSLLHYTRKVGETELLQDIAGEKPDLVGFSASTPEFRHVSRMAGWIKRCHNLSVICGGVHATLVPHDVLDEQSIDMVCVGEGDESAVELCDALERGEPITAIPGIWVKQNGIRHTPANRPLIEDLDRLPLMDREVFDFVNLMPSKNGVVRARIGRGCQFSCAYCCNKPIRQCYPNPNKYVRYRSVDSLLDELEQVAGSYPFIKYVTFHDDIFPRHGDWMQRFAREYPERVGLPFRVAFRPELLDDEMASLMARAGCVKVNIGLESGNEELRREVLNRHISDEQLAEAFARCRKAGLATMSYSMLGLPFESLDTLLDTCKLNARVKADAHMRYFFYPFPQTALHKLCLERGFISGAHVDSYLDGTVLSQPTISDDQLQFAFQFFYPAVKAYALLERLPPFIRDSGDRIIRRLYKSRWIPHGRIARTYKRYTWFFRLQALGRFRRRFPRLYSALRSLKETRYQGLED